MFERKRADVMTIDKARELARRFFDKRAGIGDWMSNNPVLTTMLAGGAAGAGWGGLKGHRLDSAMREFGPPGMLDHGMGDHVYAIGGALGGGLSGAVGAALPSLLTKELMKRRKPRKPLEEEND